MLYTTQYRLLASPFIMHFSVLPRACIKMHLPQREANSTSDTIQPFMNHEKGCVYILALIARILSLTSHKRNFHKIFLFLPLGIHYI